MVPERPINANPGIKFCCSFFIYLPILQVKAQKIFLRSRAIMALGKLELHVEKKTLLKFCLIPG